MNSYSDIFERENEISEMLESYAASQKDFEFDLASWKKGGKNILFVTGLSGSGKSTRAKKLGKDNGAIVIEIDLFEHNRFLYAYDRYEDSNKDNPIDRSHYTDGEWIVKEYFDKTYHGEHKFNFSHGYEEFWRELDKFLKYIISYAGKHRDQLFVVEGIQIMETRGEVLDLIKGYPCIVTGTSFIQSAYRAAKREGIKEYAKSFSSLKALKEWIDWYMSQEKDKKAFTKELKNSSRP